MHPQLAPVLFDLLGEGVVVGHRATVPVAVACTQRRGALVTRGSKLFVNPLMAVYFSSRSTAWRSARCASRTDRPPRGGAAVPGCAWTQPPPPDTVAPPQVRSGSAGRRRGRKAIREKALGIRTYTGRCLSIGEIFDGGGCHNADSFAVTRL
ncbi:hypothetical protein GCM10010399_76940 [Dactylosporangium fulvum]